MNNNNDYLPLTVDKLVLKKKIKSAEGGDLPKDNQEVEGIFN